MPCTISDQDILETVSFHGHSCPGLMIGIRAAELVLRELDHPKDSEIVAVVETDMCGVDAIQFLTGATLGKGNFIHRDYGKMAFSFFHKGTGKGFRAVLRPEARGPMNEEMTDLQRRTSHGSATDAERGRLDQLRSELEKRFQELSLEEMFAVTPLAQGSPRPARILQTFICERCGEQVMEFRTRRFAGQILCIPCFDQVEQKV